MKIGIIGATGKAGQKIMKEALDRGHEVRAFVRSTDKLKGYAVEALEKDVFTLAVEDLKGLDVVVNAFGAAPGKEHQHVDFGRHLIDIMEKLPETRLIVVGGAGSLYVDEALTLQVMNTPEFPPEFYPTASNQGKNLEDLKASKNVRWTFISPSAFFDPEGKRTGKYIMGKDNLLVNAKGESYVSYADYAVALVDEIEAAKHVKERFTVASEKE